MNYFLLLNRHKNIARKRQADYKRNLIVVVALIFSIIFVAGMLFAPLPEEDLENFAPFLLPALVFFDFSVRFVIKKNAGAGIFPYLTLPVPRKSLIWHIVLADLQSLWIWGCWLIYCVISGFCGVLTFWAATELLFLILIN
ncbi:MAG: hypothetical protein LBS01_11660, partial [Prevotellaceae bacterium]|nr:hypothetical protein [Prevotellaceae bacterium]